MSRVKADGKDILQNGEYNAHLCHALIQNMAASRSTFCIPHFGPVCTTTVLLIIARTYFKICRQY